jgi:hypothetical protein
MNIAIFAKLKDRIRRIARSAPLPTALTLAVVISLVLVTVSVVLYSTSGYSKLDLSRPGFEHERAEVKETEQQKTYDTTSPITKKTIDDFLQEYDHRASETKANGNFQDQPLGDDDLQLSE